MDNGYRVNLRRWRIDNDLGLREMAALLDLPVMTYVNHESGRTKFIRPEFMKPLMKLTSLSEQEINEQRIGEKNELKEKAKRKLAKA